MTDLDMILRRWDEDAAALTRNGEPDKAAILKRCAVEVHQAAAEWLTWIPEEQAALRSGKSTAWWRGEYPALQKRGHARQVGHGKRVYRLAIVPQRDALVIAAEEGRKVARAMRGAA